MKNLASLLVAYCLTLAGLSAATAPVAVNQSVSTVESSALYIQITATDADAGDVLTYQVTTPPSVGTLACRFAHRADYWIYTCKPGFVGTDTFTFTTTDQTGLKSNTATVTISVKSNVPPTAKYRRFIAHTNQVLPSGFAYVDPDVDIPNIPTPNRQKLVFSLVTLPSHGTIVLTGSSFQYTPATGYEGPDSFTWKVSDGLATSAPATVSLVVRKPTDRAGEVIEVVVNETLYPEVKLEVDRLRDDLLAEGYAARLVTWPAVSNVTEMWNHFKAEYDRTDQVFTGAILIGSLPKPYGTAYNDLHYWNMDAPADVKYSVETSSCQIWVSRIIADTSSYGSEKVLIKRALEANHAYRTGRSRLPHAAHVYDAFAYTTPTLANSLLSLWSRVALRTELSDKASKEKFLARTDTPTGADALVAGGELFEECSHGNSSVYMNANFSTAQLFRFIAQQRFGLLESCTVGAFGGIGNHHIFTRGGGLVWAVSGTITNYVGDWRLTPDYPNATRVRSLLASGESWGRSLLDRYPFYAWNRTVHYGDLSMGVKMSPSNELPVVTAFTASASKIDTGSSATFNLTFTDADLGTSDSPYASYEHRIEWFLEGYDGGRKEPVAVQDLNGATTASITRTFSTPGVYTARVEVIDEWQARGWKELTITVCSPPTAVADSATVAAGGTVVIPVLANDADPDGRPLTLATTFPPPAPLHGTRTVSGNSVIYTNSDRSWTGTETFGYTVGNGLASSTGLVTVTVTGDVTPPTLVAVQSLGAANQVMVIASEPLADGSGPHGAANPANYTLDHGIAVVGAVRNADTRSVTLTVSPNLVAGTTYLLQVSNVQDTAAVPNTIQAGSQMSFQYTPRANGLAWDYFTGNGATVPDFTLLTPVASGVSPNVNLAMRTQELNFAVRFSGMIKIDTAGTYIFTTASNDGSQLFVDGVLVVNNTANNMTQKSSASLTLSAGFHDLVLAYAQGTAAMGLELWWQGPSIAKALVPDAVLWHTVNTPPTITAIPNQTVAEDGIAAAIPLTVGDAQSNPAVLTLSATTSNATLLPVAQITFSGTGTDRQVSVAPGTDQHGTATVTVRVSDGVNLATESFSVTVAPVNDPPRCTDQPRISGTIQAGQTLTALAGTWNDTVDGGSLSARAYQWQRIADPGDPENTAVSLAGATAMTYVPVAADVGAYLRVLEIATDNGSPLPKASAAAASLWTTMVTASGTLPPSISTIADLTMNEDSTSSAIGFTISDAETTADLLALSATSSNPTLIPSSNVVLGGSWSNRTVKVTPAANRSGSATIQVTVIDTGGFPASTTFTVTVLPINDPPVCTALPAITGAPQVGQTLTAASGTWNDLNDSGTIASFAYQWQRANSATGSGVAAIAGATAATYVPVAADMGKFLRVQVTGTDAGTPTPAKSTTASSAYTTAITSGTNTAPTISVLADLTVAEDTATGVLAITVGDAQTAATALTLTASSSNPALVPVAGIVLGGSGAGRTVTVTPAANQSGSATITVTVSDGSLTANEPFVLTVNAVNDAPVNTVAPAIAGTAQVGQTLTASTGTWNDTADAGPIATYAYQWQRADSATGTNLAAIAGATAATYVPVAADAGKFLRVQVTATDAGTPAPVKSATVASAYTTAITSGTNTAPTISVLADLTVAKGTSTGALAFTVGDAQTAATALTLTATSSNTALVPVAAIVFGGSAASRTVTVTPAAGQHGLATITVTVSDGSLTASEPFVLTVTGSPAILSLPTLTATVGSAYSYAITATGTPAPSLSLSGAPAWLTLSGSTLSGTPTASGTFGPITLTAANGVPPDATQTFSLAVSAALTDLTDPGTGTITAQGEHAPAEAKLFAFDNLTSRKWLDFAATNPSTRASWIQYRFPGTDQGVVSSYTITSANDAPERDPANWALLGSNDGGATWTTLDTRTGESFASRLLKKTYAIANTTGYNIHRLRIDRVANPATANSVQIAEIELLGVPGATNTAPTISALADLTVAEDAATGALAVTVSDAQTAATALTLTATSSNPALVPVAGIVLGGSGSARTVTVTPAANQSGSATITVTVSDGSLTASEPFVLTVTAVNDAPVNTVAPAVTGTAKVGQTLTASTGTWHDAADAGTIAAYAYQWQRADNATGANLASIAGATAAAYVPVAADLGKFLRVQVTATDAGTPTPAKSATAASAYTAAVTAVAPLITSHPASVTHTVGQPASFTVAATGTPAPTYQWQRLISGVWTAISGANATTYATSATILADHGAQFRVVAANSGGSITSNVATLTVTAAGTLPTPWSAGDIGTTGGSVSYQGMVGAGEGVTVTGCGNDIWGSTDAFRFACQPLTGDGTIIARVGSQTNSNAWAKAGVMFRDSLTSGSRHAFAMVTPTSGVGFQRRTTTGGASAHTAGSRSAAPRWLRLVRNGTTITASESADGVAWTQLGSTSWPMGSILYVGLAVTSHAGMTPSTAVFDNVQIIPSGGG